MILGIGLIVGLVVLTEWIGRSMLAKIGLPELTMTFLINCSEILLALFAYISLYRFYEHRNIDELRFSAFWVNASKGFLTGLILQSLIIVVIYFSGNYVVYHVNPFSFLLPGFISALTAGFIAEILIIGVFFRIIEEKIGTTIALVIMGSLFAVLHGGAANATILSASSTVIVAGILLPAFFVLTRSLWFPIFMHFAWDFAEPAIYGGINPSMTVTKTLFISKISGISLVSGGKFGPQSSLQCVIFCLTTTIMVLIAANKTNKFKKPFWKIKNANPQAL